MSVLFYFVCVVVSAAVWFIALHDDSHKGITVGMCLLGCIISLIPIFNIIITGCIVVIVYQEQISRFLNRVVIKKE